MVDVMTARLPALTRADLVVGKWYRAKRFARIGWDGNNDRTIVGISPFDAGDLTEIQYDSDTVKMGSHLPKTTVGAFLRWARCEAPELVDGVAND